MPSGDTSWGKPGTLPILSDPVNPTLSLAKPQQFVPCPRKLLTAAAFFFSHPA